MKKLLLVILALTLSAGMWANELEDAKVAAVEEIELSINGITNTDILGVANTAKTQIMEAKTEEAVNSIKTFALTKINALVLIQTTRQGIQNEEINSWIDGAFNDIKNGGPDATPRIDEIREKIMAIIKSVQIGKEEGKAEGIEEGKAAAFGDMGEEKTNCPAVKVTKGEQEVILYAPEKVEFIKVSNEE